MKTRIKEHILIKNIEMWLGFLMILQLFLVSYF